MIDGHWVPSLHAMAQVGWKDYLLLKLARRRFWTGHSRVTPGTGRPRHRNSGVNHILREGRTCSKRQRLGVPLHGGALHGNPNAHPSAPLASRRLRDIAVAVFAPEKDAAVPAHRHALASIDLAAPRAVRDGSDEIRADHGTMNGAGHRLHDIPERVAVPRPFLLGAAHPYGMSMRSGSCPAMSFTSPS